MSGVGAVNGRFLAALCTIFGVCSGIREVESDGTIITDTVARTQVFGLAKEYKRISFHSAVVQIANGIKSTAGTDDLGKWKIGGCDHVLANMGVMSVDQIIGDLTAYACLKSWAIAKAKGGDGPSEEEKRRREAEAKRKAEEKEAAQKKQKEEAEAKRKEKEAEQARKQAEAKNRQQDNSVATIKLDPHKKHAYYKLTEEDGKEVIEKQLFSEPEYVEMILNHLRRGGRIEFLD